MVSVFPPASRQDISIDQFLSTKDDYYYDLPAQRGLCWKLEDEVALIKTIMRSGNIGTIVINIRDNIKEVLDAQQRINTVFKFFNDEFSLPNDFLTIKSGDMIYSGAGKKFSELDMSTQIHLKSRLIQLEIYNNLTEQEANDIILNKNRGVPFTKIQMIRALASMNIKKTSREIYELDFFEYSVSPIIRTEKKKDYLEGTIYRILMMVSNGFKDISYSNKNVEEWILEQKETPIKPQIKRSVINIFEYLYEAFPEKTKALNSYGVIVVYLVAKELYKKLDPREFWGMINAYLEDTDQELIIETRTLDMNLFKDAAYKVLKFHKDNPDKIQPKDFF